MAFAAEGATVWATDRDGEFVATIEGCIARQMDVLDPEAIAVVIHEAGTLDALFNCAGHARRGNGPRLHRDGLELLARAQRHGHVPHDKTGAPRHDRGWQGIDHQHGAVASSVVGVPNRFAYGASKAAVIGLTKSVARDFAATGVRCNAICPGTVDTPSLRQRLSASGDFETAWEAFKARQPMGRLGDPQEIAALAVYLASDEFAFTTGQCHVIDGGWTA